jgi:hypothetical protein
LVLGYRFYYYGNLIQNNIKGLKKKTSIRLKMNFIVEARLNADETKTSFYIALAPEFINLTLNKKNGGQSTDV